MPRFIESGWAQRLLPWLAVAFAALFLSSCQQGPAGPSGTGAPGAPGGPPIVTAPGGIPTEPGQVAIPPHMAGRTPVRVALLLPVSASSAEVRGVAQSLLDSGQLAVFEVGNPDLLLVPKDTHGTAAGAEAAAREALAEGAELILGPLLREEVVSVAPLARARGVPVLAFSTDRSVAGNGVYLLSFQPEQEVARVTQYAVSQGRFSFAALIPNTDYGVRVREAYAESVRQNGARLSVIQSYTRAPEAMVEPVKALAQYQQQSIKDGVGPIPASGPADGTGTDTGYQGYGVASFDAVLLPEGGTLLRALAPLLPYFDVDPRHVKFLGTGLWDDPVIGREPALVGGWFAAPAPDARTRFLTRYTEAYGKTPPRIASLSFDAVALAGALARQPVGARFSQATLTNPNGFSGIDGIFRFLPDGGTERGLAVLEVTPNGFTVISPAPTTFETGYTF